MHMGSHFLLTIGALSPLGPSTATSTAAIPCKKRIAEENEQSLTSLFIVQLTRDENSGSDSHAARPAIELNFVSTPIKTSAGVL